MTKIKDLVTVTVENVFRNFPIDSERYELVDLVETMIAHDSLMAVHEFVETIENERTKSFLITSLDSFLEFAKAAIRVVRSDSPDQLPLIVYDRYRRVFGVFDQFDRVQLQVEDEAAALEIATWAILFRFRDVLRKEHVIHGVRFGHGAVS